MTDTNLDWKNLSFGYIRTDFNIRSYFRDGAWTKPELTSDETVTMHMAATALHYGQEAIEGQKAFRGADGKIRVFRMHVSGETVALSPPDRYNTVIQPWVSGSSPYWIARSLW